ncbi:MAG: hypothetical protein HQK89_13440 [Nitrospirae bacterium]|nr:hypothetical protein [Nitrospirota bacterium]
MAKAISLYSSGLDSTLATIVIVRQGIEVTAVKFLTHFGCDMADPAAYLDDYVPHAEQFGFRVKYCHLGEVFLEIVKSPAYGRGKNMNPCVDCRIAMLREAKKLMALTGADFLITGEVLWQRPMSQRRDSFPLIDRAAGVEGIVLRPLTAKLLKPTIAETNGLVDREKLYGFSGRSRKPQMALAKEFGLTDYPAPAGGCLLTDSIYSYRLSELLRYTPNPSLREVNLLKTGRHFRLSPSIKAIAGRNEKENIAIEAQTTDEDITLTVDDVGSPTTLILAQAGQKLEPGDAIVEVAASITARYAKTKHDPQVNVSIYKGVNKLIGHVLVKPLDEETLNSLRIEAKSG